MGTTPQTWHYGLVARWWAEFNEGGPEIDYFRRFIERDGQPALDVACGPGRLLLPYVRAGLDVDGCDVSADMIALCREQAEREGLSPTLFIQAMHELDPPRTYRTVFLDPLEQQAVLEMRAYMWLDGELLAEEEHRITLNLYLRNELLLMLDRAGFVDVAVHGDHEEQEA